MNIICKYQEEFGQEALGKKIVILKPKPKKSHFHTCFSKFQASLVSHINGSLMCGIRMNQDHGMEVQVSSFDWQVRVNDKTNLTKFWENINSKKKIRKKLFGSLERSEIFRAFLGEDLVCSWCIFGGSTRIQVSLQFLK